MHLCVRIHKHRTQMNLNGYRVWTLDYENYASLKTGITSSMAGC